jgi:hypothetical protein
VTVGLRVMPSRNSLAFANAERGTFSQSASWLPCLDKQQKYHLVCYTVFNITLHLSPLHYEGEPNWNPTIFKLVREEVRPVKSEITIYNFRNFNLCKVYKFIVQNAPKLNVLSKNHALLLMPKVTKNRYIFNNSN